MAGEKLNITSKKNTNCTSILNKGTDTLVNTSEGDTFADVVIPTPTPGVTPLLKSINDHIDCALALDFYICPCFHRSHRSQIIHLKEAHRSVIVKLFMESLLSTI